MFMLFLALSLAGFSKSNCPYEMQFERYGSDLSALSNREVTDSVHVASKIYYQKDVTYFEINSAAYDDTGDYWPAQVFERITFPDPGGKLNDQIEAEVRLLQTQFNTHRSDIMRAYVVERTRADILQSDNDSIALELKITWGALAITYIGFCILCWKKE